MASLSSQELQQAIPALLDQVIPPGIDKGIVTLGFLQSVVVSEENHVTLQLQLRAPHIRHRVWIEEQCRIRLAELREIKGLAIEVVEARPAQPAQRPQFNTSLLEGVRHIIAVSSGKGGVGKSTIAANLAAALALEGKSVGVLDADIYGPSMSMMFGVAEDPEVFEDRTIAPPTGAGGVKVVSMAMFSDPNEATIWRGPMASQMIQNFLFHVRWGKIDYLVIDMPPGTGDIQLSLTQNCPMAGAVVVTTPQEISVIDARKGLKMFEKVGVPVLGVIENMSGFICDSCNKHHDIFGSGGGQRIAESHGVPFLGGVPLEIAVGYGADSGRPVVLTHPNSKSARQLLELARTVMAQVEQEEGVSTLGAYSLEGEKLERLDQVATAILEASSSRYPVPVRIGRSEGSELIFDWSDGKRTVAGWRDLRLHCPCASCVDEWTGKKLLNEKEIPSSIFPRRLDAVGRYAVRIVWSDGHDTGIYSYDYLRRLEVEKTAGAD